jgi:adenylate kinase family enzyme
LRANVKEGTKLGKKTSEYTTASKLILIALIVNLVKDRLAQLGIAERGCHLDGFPRAPDQAKAIVDAGIAVNKFVLIEVPDDTLVERGCGRWLDPEAGDTHHQKFRVDETTDVSYWYVIDTHVYAVGPSQEDHDWFHRLRHHCKQRSPVQLPPASSAGWCPVLSAPSEPRPPEEEGEGEEGSRDVQENQGEEGGEGSQGVPEGQGEPTPATPYIGETPHNGSPPTRWRQDSLNAVSPQHAPDFWRRRDRPIGRGQSPASASAGREGQTSVAPHVESQAPKARPHVRWMPMSAPAVVGLATFASATRPAFGEISTCDNYGQLSESSGVVPWWSLIGIVLFVIIIGGVAMFAYTVWLFRYLGARVQPTLVNAATQKELKCVSRSTVWRVSIYNGLAHWWQWE